MVRRGLAQDLGHPILPRGSNTLGLQVLLLLAAPSPGEHHRNVRIVEQIPTWIVERSGQVDCRKRKSKKALVRSLSFRPRLLRLLLNSKLPIWHGYRRPPLFEMEDYLKAKEYASAYKGCSNDQKLKFYGLFKQVEVGDVNTSRPGFFDPVGGAKWDSWKGFAGLSSEEAKLKYVEAAQEIGFMPSVISAPSVEVVGEADAWAPASKMEEPDLFLPRESEPFIVPEKMQPREEVEVHVEPLAKIPEVSRTSTATIPEGKADKKGSGSANDLLKRMFYLEGLELENPLSLALLWVMHGIAALLHLILPAAAEQTVSAFMIGNVFGVGLFPALVIWAAFKVFPGPQLGISWTYTLVLISYLTLIWCLDMQHLKPVTVDRYRPITWLQEQALAFWASHLGYFPITLEVDDTASIDPSKQYVFGVHPHGIHCWPLNIFALRTSAWHNQFPKMRMSGIAASVIFKIPMVRELFLAQGYRDARLSVCQKILKSGASIYIVTGGEAESLATINGRDRVVLGDRKGFVRLALSYGCPLIPVFGLGNSEVRPTPACDPPYLDTQLSPPPALSISASLSHTHTRPYPLAGLQNIPAHPPSALPLALQAHQDLHPNFPRAGRHPSAIQASYPGPCRCPHPCPRP